MSDERVEELARRLGHVEERMERLEVENDDLIRTLDTVAHLLERRLDLLLSDRSTHRSYAARASSR